MGVLIDLDQRRRERQDREPHRDPTDEEIMDFTAVVARCVDHAIGALYPVEDDSISYHTLDAEGQRCVAVCLAQTPLEGIALELLRRYIDQVGLLRARGMAEIVANGRFLRIGIIDRDTIYWQRCDI